MEITLRARFNERPRQHLQQEQAEQLNTTQNCRATKRVTRHIEQNQEKAQANHKKQNRRKRQEQATKLPTQPQQRYHQKQIAPHAKTTRNIAVEEGFIKARSLLFLFVLKQQEHPKENPQKELKTSNSSRQETKMLPRKLDQAPLQTKSKQNNKKQQEKTPSETIQYNTTQENKMIPTR